MWRHKKQYDKALADFNESIQLDPKFAEAHRDLAWLRATCPDAKFRDGKRALESAKKALELDEKNGLYKDAMAAAHAELGNFKEAVRWQTEALQDPLYRDDEAFRRRLELYRAKMPYRE